MSLHELFSRNISEVSSSRPLGIREGIELTPEQLHSLEVIEQYDLSFVNARMSKDQKVPDILIEPAIGEMKKFFGLHAVFPQKQLPMPSFTIDEAWHTFILFTRRYHDFGMQAFGHRFEHDPFEESDPNPQQTWDDFEQMYRTAYGELHHLWRQGQPSSRDTILQ